MRNTGATIATLTITLATLLIVSAAALPVLTVNNPQSYANYQLNATVRAFESCAATPSNYSGVACGNPNFQGPSLVTVTDDGQCYSASDQACQFSPKNVTISVGGFVGWQNLGRLNHTVTSDSPSFPFNIFLRPSSTFNTAGTFSNGQTFNEAGTFTYHCIFHPWLTGAVMVSQPLAPPPKIQVFNVSGPVSWTVVGLDTTNAILSINHQIRVYNATTAPQKLLFSESGVIEDSIDLATRVESADLTRVLYSIPYLYTYAYGYGSGYGGPLNLQTGGAQLTGQIGTPVGPGIAYYYPYFYTPPKVHTLWWVNGPLSLGATVEVLILTGSVRGSETLNLGGSLSSRDAWMVGSQFKEQYSQPQPQIPPGSPYPSYFVSNQSIATSEQFDYGKQSDLLFKSSDTIKQFNQFNTIYPPGSSLFGGGVSVVGIFPVGGGPRLTETVTVTRTQETSVSIALNLVSTNINLVRNASPPSGGSTSTAQAAIMPMIYTATGIVATVLVGGTVWLALRARRKTQVQTSSKPQIPSAHVKP